MKLFFTSCALLFLAYSVGCQSENRNNSRAYVQGKFTGNTGKMEEIKVMIISENRNVAETIPDNFGNFVLSGPLLSQIFGLKLNRKIKSFSASKTGCILSSDAMEISVPAGLTYIIFNEIELE